MVLVQIKPDKLQQKKDKQTIKNRTINNTYYFLTPPSVCYIIPFCVTCDGGGRKGGTNTAIPHMVAREYRNIKISPNTETAVTNGKKLTLSMVQILFSNRNNTFVSVFRSQGASKSGVR